MPTIRRCCIIGCLSNSRQNPQLQFFQFPRPENPFHSLWKQACHASLSRILPFKKPVVCALHFHPDSIGGRRLISSAVPSLRLEVPTNLKAVEQQAMVEEIERSRKCAYINAVVYEWLVRANLNPQLRGSITHGMIKEKADTAKQVIGAPSFVADNRWLNRFRETHLTGFAHKLATNQLRPSGPSLWIPDIVQDLQHLFPPASADRLANFENVPEQYYDYLQQQYGEYEDDDDQSTSDHRPSPTPPPSATATAPADPQSAVAPGQRTSPGAASASVSTSPSDAYEQQSGYNNSSYDDFYYERQTSPDDFPASPAPAPVPVPAVVHSRTASQQQRSKSQSPYPSLTKRPRLQEDDDVRIVNEPHVEDLTEGGPATGAANGKARGGNGAATPNGRGSPRQPNSNGNGRLSNGRASSATSSSASPVKDLTNYAQALEYLKPLEDFALFKENFRAIGLISQLEVILRKGDRLMAEERDD